MPMKLNELENQINKAFFGESDSPIINQHIHADIEQRLTFVKKLLSAEMASDPDPAKQSYLENMWERVRELEAGYRGSGTGSSTTISTIDHVDNVGDDDDDQASNCSCPETFLQEDDVSDDLESTLGHHDTGVCVDLIEEKKAMPVTVFNNVLFEGKVGDDNDGVEDEFRDHVEKVLLLDDMSRNGASVEDEQEEMEEKQIRAYVDLKKSEKKKKGLGFGKFCAVVVSVFVIAMAFIISLEDEDYEGHGRFLAPT